MADFDQANDELSNFLDQTFSEPQQETQKPQEQEDDEIKEYLTYDEDDVPQQTADVANSAPTEQPQQPAQVSDQERILNLERELAATRTRSQLYENALQQQYQRQFAPQQQEEQLPNVAFQDSEIIVDDRFETDYGDANPYITAIAKRVANDLYQRSVVPLQQELQAVRGQLQSQTEFNQRQSADTLHMQLKSVVPDIDEIVRTPEWKSYINQPDQYGSGRTIASYVQEGIQYGNVRQLAQIAQQFKQLRQQSAPQQQQVAPGRAQTTVPSTASKRGPMLKMSDFDRATQAAQAGKLSWDKYQVIANEFNEAMLDGRVNLSK